MPDLRKIAKWAGYSFLLLLGVLLVLFAYLYRSSLIEPPAIADHSPENWQRTEASPGFYYLGNSWFRKSNSGLYELYVEGDDFERGVVNGKLTKELVQRQEDYFSRQIEKLIPSAFYRHFLKYFVGWFNRKLAGQVKEEYKREIYGVSLSASEKYAYIGSPYQRMLNYHAAHDIGHALQSMALVGCTSFGTWNDRSEDSTMILGRNFDFYAGDKFAEDKIVAFFKPAKGYGYMTVTWGGFTGTVSGMNEKGLTVTINAAKTDIPSGSATPVSLVAREMLQYAGTIQQALQIARSRRMFVSESFLVGSAVDGKAVIIEKTPDSLDVYDPHQNYIVCTNHFQSKGLLHTKTNTEQIEESASAYRYQRVMELLNKTPKNSAEATIRILRDYKGLQGADIGMGNEKAINQFIAHHSIVFEPMKRKVWVSTAPWQSGKFIGYDLSKVLALRGLRTDREIMDSSLLVPADTLLATASFTKFLQFRNLKQRVADGEKVNPDSIVASNPNYYHAYVLAGDICRKAGNKSRAIHFYRQALTKEFATLSEKKAVEENLRLMDKD